MWIVNTSTQQLDVCILELKKWVYFMPGRPMQLENFLAMKYAKKYGRRLKICDDPRGYFTESAMKYLVVRDAGIGDLLLLEPVLRKFKEGGNIDLTVLTRYPEVYEANPYIDNVLTMEVKNHISVNTKDYDAWEDLRSYSETSNNRHRAHRTDIYNEKFNLSIDDKEPRLYFKKQEKILLDKKKGFKYIGLSVDASHKYRTYPHHKKFIDYILEQDDKNIVVLFGENNNIDYDHERVIDLQCKTNIRQLINYVRGLDYLVAVDSGIMHIGLTLHIPTVCLFSIITPEFRVKYYTGPFEVITANLKCIGCGDWHMSKCQYELADAPCLDIPPERIYENMIKLNKKETVEYNSTDIVKVNIIPHSAKKLTMPIIVQNEEHNLPRFIDNVMSNSSIGRVIAIDGGSTDKTVELLKKAGAEVYIHPYIKTYHEQQAMQRNISCSYVKDGENILIMDIDECFSKELEEYLPALIDSQSIQYGLISRRTFNYYDDIADPIKAIKDYPDWQPRFYKWDRKYKFVGGAHHITLSCPSPIKIKKDIIHFEKENKNRENLEKQWEGMMQGVRQYA